MNIVGKIIIAVTILSFPLQAKEKEQESKTSLKLPEFKTTVIQKEELVANMAYEVTIEAINEEAMKKLVPYTQRIIDAINVAIYSLMGAAYDRDDVVPQESIIKHLTGIIIKLCPKNTIKDVMFTKYNIIPSVVNDSNEQPS